MRIAVVIPAYNEAAALPKVLEDLPRELIWRVVVSDNGSDDGTPEVARAHGAEVVREDRRGYGWACWAGVRAILHDCDVIAMLDAGGKEDATELPLLLQPILDDQADFVLGSRVRFAAPDALTHPQRFGNWLTTQIMARLYGTRVTDLAPFRAIRSPLLHKLDMQERTFGWPTEMIVKAARAGARISEVDVHYRPRYAGKSKVSGTVKGSAKAGVVILRTAFRYAHWEPNSKGSDRSAL
jgi:glycosyltransferase involved in cell wall biosynthesis